MEESLGRYLPRPTVLAGDITVPQCGLSQADRHWLAEHCNEVLHSAASLSFIEDRGEPYRSNVLGVEHVIGLCDSTRIRRIAHISTAYVAGLAKGRFYEHELDRGQEHANVYESSKAQAERLIRESWAFDEFTIFRPSIIVGDSRTGFTSSYHGFYAPLRVLQALSPTFGQETLFAVDYLQTLGLRGEERKNFVTVDWVSDSIVKVLIRQTERNQTYALTSPTPLRVSALRDAYAEAIKAVLSLPNRAQSNGVMETFQNQFRETFQVYESYWRDDCDFDRTNLEALLPESVCPVVDREMAVMLSRYALQSNFGFGAKKQSRPDSAWESLRRLHTDPSRSDSQPLDLVVVGPGGTTARILASPGGPKQIGRGIDKGDAPWLRLPAAALEDCFAGRNDLTKLCEEGIAASTWPVEYVESLGRWIQAV